MIKTHCKYCLCDMILEDSDFEIYEKLSPIINWNKYILKPVNICPDCYEQIRLSFRNKRNLYKTKCDFSWKDIISIYSPDKNIKVYDKDIWWSDKWNALDYAMIFDENKSFFEQLNDLVYKVPFPNLSIVNSENSDYNDSLLDSKNAYMCFWNNNIEDTYYTEESRLIKNSSDIWWSGEIEKSYECIDCSNIYNSKYCYNSSNCSNVIFCKKCYNCHDCFMCYWLESKKFYILNKEYTEEEYKNKMKDIDLSDYDKLLDYIQLFKDFELTLPHMNFQTNNSLNCIWDYVYNSKNSSNCFNIVWVQDSKNLYEWWRCSDVYDSSFIYDLEWPVIWSVTVFMSCKNVYFSEYIYDNCFNIFYSFNLKSCKNCFWCVWLVWKEYCILNKEYKKEDYFNEVEKIIKSMMKNNVWWNFFPAELSRFWYNETEANEYYPLSRESVIASVTKQSSKYWINNKTMLSGSPHFVRDDNSETFIQWPIFNWSTYEAPFPKVDKIISALKLPSKTKDIPDDILNRAIKCEETWKLFKISPFELKFYKDNNLSIPRFHYDTRYKHRLLLKNQRKIYERICEKCGIEIKTTYSPERPEIVYCETCYNNYIYK